MFPLDMFMASRRLLEMYMASLSDVIKVWPLEVFPVLMGVFFRLLCTVFTLLLAIEARTVFL